ncbi:MAG: arginine--tRNA ligase [Endomicrobium sp.]|jgi:arginyl-tRNA synthetase|nr:arginine--tRNA ligase [Endomicrobium sp.]
MIKKYLNSNFDIVVNNYLKMKRYNAISNLHCNIVVPPKIINCDFSVNIIMTLATKLKISAENVSQDLFIMILKDKNLSEIIEKVQLVKPYFYINFNIKDTFLHKQIIQIMAKQNDYTILPRNKRGKVILEFISANPTGPLHIGHGRGAAIGESLSRILKYLGYNVIKEYYLNDMGNQISILVESVKLRYRQLKGETISFPDDYYKGDYIINLAKGLLRKENNISKINIKLETMNYILQSIKQDISNLEIHFDSWFFESSLTHGSNSQIKQIIKYLTKKGYVYINNNATWLTTTKFGDDKDRVLLRSDGSYTYFALDVAYHMNKLQRGFNKIINIWGADHYGYVNRIKSAMQMFCVNKNVIRIVLYQLVSIIKNKHIITMSTRKGEFIPLKDIIKTVGPNVCKFFFLLRDPKSQLEFNLQLAQSNLNSNPLFYIQYAYARCNSIIVASQNISIIQQNLEMINLNLLNTKIERTLMKHLVMFDDTLTICAINMSPHYLTMYLIKLADIYHKFYETCSIIKNVNSNLALTEARLTLVKCVMLIIRNGLNLLGISVMKNM